MNEQAFYLQTKQIQLDKYEEKLNKIKKNSSVSSFDTKNEFHERIAAVELTLKDAKSKLEIASKTTNEEAKFHKKAIEKSFRTTYSHFALS